jgi:hypothetical protein
MAHLPEMKYVRLNRGNQGSGIFVEFLLNGSLARRHLDFVEIVVCNMTIKFETRKDSGGIRLSEIGRFEWRSRCMLCEGLRGGNEGARALFPAIIRHLADD